MESAIQDRSCLPDPYDVHQENMQRLKVVSMMKVPSKSAPNSPMLNRGLHTDREHKKKFLSPSPIRKTLNVEATTTLSKSCDDLAKSRSRSTSPSPSHSPSSSPREQSNVSGRIIQAHYLYNTSERPGSFMLKKSSEILKQKSSPQGSLLTLSTTPNTIVVSPAQEDSMLGFQVPTMKSDPENPEGAKNNIGSVKRKSTKTVLEQGSAKDSLSQGEFEDKNVEKAQMRMDIGMALAKGLEPQSLPAVQIPTKHQSHKIRNPDPKIAREEKIKEISNKVAKESGAIFTKKHHYIKYGNLERDPGLLTPPKESRGSVDLAAEMTRILDFKKERRIFNDLEHVEEMSSIHSGEDSNEVQSMEDGTNNEDAKKNPGLVITMPPVFESKPTELKYRDYEEPLDPKLLEFDEEDYEKLKKCKYLRQAGEMEEEEEEEAENFSDISSDSESETQD